MTRHVYKIGDKVRILRPKFISRVGYPLSKSDMVTIVESEETYSVMAASLGYKGRALRAFQVGCATAELYKRGFGGKTRSIHYFDATPTGGWSNQFLNAVGRMTEVYEKRVVMTGVYFPPCGGVSYDGEYDYENGGLRDRKSHILLSTDFGEIEACDVEFIK